MGGLERGFCQFVLKPVKLMIESVMNEKKDIYEPLIKAFRIKLPNERFDRPKDLMKAIMRNWLPAGYTLLGMIVTHLPSPAVAQRYRVNIRTCNADGPLSMYVPLCFKIFLGMILIAHNSENQSSKKKSNVMFLYPYCLTHFSIKKLLIFVSFHSFAIGATIRFTSVLLLALHGVVKNSSKIFAFV